MKSSMKRLAKDQIALRRSLPPNYFFADPEDSQSLPDDLTQLLICLTGPEGTPYSQGVWHIRLNIPTDYPQQPPTATFQTRIFHPNVAEETGAVCLETLKRDWDPKLTLKEILVTISCLLIQPNPDSALNEKAGALIREDYEAFGRQARLMTKVHAPIPQYLAQIAHKAKGRGEEGGGGEEEGEKRDESELEKVRTSQSKPPSARDKTRHNVLKENLLVESFGTAKNSNDRPPKRPLATTAVSAGPSKETDKGAGTEPRRKSPKYSHPTESAQDQNVAVDDISDFTKDCHSHEEDASTPTKIIFRAQWTPAPGKLRIKARIGIRRL